MSENVRNDAAGDAPDFQHDDAVIAAYESAKLSYIRAITLEAENKLRDAFAKKRDAINAEIENLRALAKVRQDTASAATARYASKLPNRVRKSGIRPPSLWDRIRTFNRVDRWYSEAAKASEELEDVNDMLRKRRDRLDAMERETRRSIYLREEAVRKKLQTPEGLQALHADPMVRSAFAKMQVVMNERATYDERVKRGEVPPQEARDREMRQRGQTFATAPLEGVMIARIARYGPLEYYVLRDLTNREQLLSCDPALEPLRDVVVDVSRTGSGGEATLRNTADGVPMRALDHLRACFSPSDASELYSRHRAALRTDRALKKTPPHDADEAALIGLLTGLARTVAQRAAAAPEAS